MEENADLPGAFSITLPVALTSTGDYDTVSDPRLAPLSNIAVTAQAADGLTHCLIDGYVLAQQIHLDTGTSNSTIKVWGQDASWLMNTTEQAKEWVDVTDGAAANSIFGDYGFTPDPSNLDDDSPAHTEDGATLMQRASDAQFLRALARRGRQAVPGVLHRHARPTHRLFRRAEPVRRSCGHPDSERRRGRKCLSAGYFLRRDAP